GSSVSDTRVLCSLAHFSPVSVYGNIKFRRETGLKRGFPPIRDMMAPLVAPSKEKVTQVHAEERSMPFRKSMAVASFLLALPFCPFPALAAEKSNAAQLVELAKSDGQPLRDAIAATFDAKDLKEGTAWAGRGPDFFFAVQSQT